MTTVTENDLQRLEELINNKFGTLNQKVDEVKANQEKMKDDITQIKIDIATLKEGQNGINKRLDNLDFIARTIIASVAVALLAGLAKILYPNLMG